MKVGDIVIAPEGCGGYLTSGKEYSIKGFWSILANTDNGHRIQITTDIGIIASCFEKGCSHLNGKSWILKPTRHEDTQDNKTIEN